MLSILFSDVLKFPLYCDKNNQSVVFVKREEAAVILAVRLIDRNSRCCKEMEKRERQEK